MRASSFCLPSASARLSSTSTLNIWPSTNTPGSSFCFLRGRSPLANVHARKYRLCGPACGLSGLVPMLKKAQTRFDSHSSSNSTMRDQRRYLRTHSGPWKRVATASYRPGETRAYSGPSQVGNGARDAMGTLDLSSLALTVPLPLERSISAQSIRSNRGRESEPVCRHGRISESALRYAITATCRDSLRDTELLAVR